MVGISPNRPTSEPTASLLPFSFLLLVPALAVAWGCGGEGENGAGFTVRDSLGVEIVDVRVKRIDFPRDVSDSVYGRMSSERERVAAELRAQGEEKAERIQADADRQKTIIVAEAYKQAEQMRGEGDARAAEIYANAYDQNREFYAFYRSLNAYRAIFEQGGDIMVLEPDSEFFEYFKNKGK